MNRFVPFLVNKAGVCPGIVAVMSEGEGPGSQPVVHPEHRQTGPNAVTTLNGDHTGYLASLVDFSQTV